MTGSSVLIDAKHVTAFGYEVFARLGVPKGVYQPVIDGLVETSLRGVDSHGIRLIPHYCYAVENGRITKDPRFSFRKTAAGTGILDADHGFGIAAGVAAMDYAVHLAKAAGIGMVTVKNSTHFAAAAIFGLQAARAGMIGLVGTDVDSLVFPHGGKETYFGTNPICFTAPVAGEDPFCVDMASSRVPLNKILAYRQAGKTLEAGWALDANGKPTTDPSTAVSPTPMGEYKGYSLAAMISVLSSVLVGMPFGPAIHPMYPLDGKRRELGHFFIALDISKFRPVSVFKKDMKRMVTELRVVPPADPKVPVLAPGDPEKEQYRLRSKKGIPVSAHDLDAFRTLVNHLHMDGKKYLPI